MSCAQRLVRIGPGGGLIDAEGRPVTPPEGWAFLPAGDAGLTRKVTARGNIWRVQAPMGRRMITKGIWAPATVIAEAESEVEAVRATAQYQHRLAAARRRRADQQHAYAGEFYQAVRAFLAFAPCYQAQEQVMAQAIASHAVPVGSGTVARTTTIPIEERAARAVIAWMRHRTTAYESMSVARIKGERRRVRRMLAGRSRALLRAYREGRDIAPGCPLARALEAAAGSEAASGCASGQPRANHLRADCPVKS